MGTDIIIRIRAIDDDRKRALLELLNDIGLDCHVTESTV